MPIDTKNPSVLVVHHPNFKAMAAKSVIGQPLPRVDALSKVTGSCIYSADVVPPNALWAGFVRSPYPHARILNIDASQARELPGVRVVVTGKDISSRREGTTLQDKPVLAQDRVRYIGEKVAAVAAVDREVVEEALGLINVEYEELPAVFDPLDAMGPEAPDLHPDYFTYQGCIENAPVKNVRSVDRASKGDISKGFAESHEIFENTFRTHMVHQAFIEPRACIVDIDSQGRVAIWHCAQSPFSLRRKFAIHTRIPEERVVVHPVAIGGSFGGKLSYEEVLCAYYLSRSTGRAVKIVESYAEALLDGQPRHAAVVILRTGVKKDGTFWGWDGKVVYNGGAYAAYTPRNALNGTFMLAGSYRIPHVRMEGYIVYTNQVPCGYFRAPGELQTLFAVESHVDMMAEALGLDPLELRLHNALREGDARATGKPVRDPQALKVLQRVSEMSGLRKPRPLPSRGRQNVLVGRGLAFGDRKIGTGECNAELQLEREGHLRLVTSVRDQGVGAHTMHRQVAARIIGVAPEQVRIEVRGTDGPYDTGIQGARGTHIEGQAVARAAAALVESLRSKAAALWGVEAKKVRWQNGRAYLSGTNKQLHLRNLARLSENGSLRGLGHYKAGRPDHYSFQAIVAEVEVDTDTGQVNVRQLRLAYDVGEVINPIIHQGQLDGAVVQGLGFSLIEHLPTEQGRMTALSLGDYKIPTICDVPPLTTSLVRGNEGPGPFGTKSVAESGISIVAPAIANAIYDATGVRIVDLPITPEKILKGLAMRKALGQKSLAASGGRGE